MAALLKVELAEHFLNDLYPDVRYYLVINELLVELIPQQIYHSGQVTQERAHIAT